jgi:hypothetical protein
MSWNLQFVCGAAFLFALRQARFVIPGLFKLALKHVFGNQSAPKEPEIDSRFKRRNWSCRYQPLKTMAMNVTDEAAQNVMVPCVGL